MGDGEQHNVHDGSIAHRQKLCDTARSIVEFIKYCSSVEFSERNPNTHWVYPLVA